MKMLIAGRWQDKKSTIPVENPFDGSLIDTVPAGDKVDLDRALESAVEGRREVAALSTLQRSKILAGASALLSERSDDFAVTIAKEVGKTIREARVEVDRAISNFGWASEEAKRIGGEIVPFESAPNGEGKFGFYFRVPVGVVAAITPFNFPLNLAVHKVAPAIAAGNSVVLKPATVTPLSGLMLGRLLLDAGLPPKGMSVITGRGSEIGDALVSDPRVNFVTLTGSPETGERIMKTAGLKKATMELGSNSGVIVMDDGDWELAARKVSAAGYALAGQVCISVQRVYVHDSHFDEFVELLKSLVTAKKLGNQLEEDTDVGPMISEEEAIAKAGWIEEAVAGGAKLVCGGGREGALLEPAILTHVDPRAKVSCKEVFAPLVCVNPIGSLEEGIEQLNDSEYGLQGAIFTRSLRGAMTAARRVEVGGFMINEVPTFRADLMPYGGVKKSGLGREGARYAIEEMTEIRLVCMDLR